VKVQIWLFCQQHTALLSSEARSVLGELEHSISEMEVEMVGQGNEIGSVGHPAEATDGSGLIKAG
jgi:hypothetical protein